MTDLSSSVAAAPVVYDGQFGPFTINERDRQGVIVYRLGLMAAALSFGVGTLLMLGVGSEGWVFYSLSLLFSLFWLSLGISLATIHIYLAPLHRTLQVFWGVGGLFALLVAHGFDQPFVQTVYDHPWTIGGVGFVFAALTGIFFKEAFCFNRLETKLLTPLVPLLLLGHMTKLLPVSWEQGLLAAWAVLFVIFAIRKAIQPIPPDIGDKSVFEYLKGQRNA